MTSSMSNRPCRVLVDARFAIEGRDIYDFLGEFGPFNGRYVPRYPRDWTERLKARIEEFALPPVKRQALLEKIRRDVFLCTVPVESRWEDEKSWGGNIENNLQIGHDDIVVGDALEPLPFVAWVDALDEIRETRRRSWALHDTVSEYVNSCRPLLVNSPGSYLIDCYLDPLSNETENLLRSLFDAAKGSKCYSIEIITRQTACGARGRANKSQPMTEDEIEERFKQIYQDILPKDRTLKLHLVGEGGSESGALRLHDRYFLTTHGTINFGQGFVVHDQRRSPRPQQFNAYVVDKEHHVRLKQTYIDGVARHSEHLPKISGIAYPDAVRSFVIQTKLAQGTPS